jgi:hypothetical protein
LLRQQLYSLFGVEMGVGKRLILVGEHDIHVLL